MNENNLPFSLSKLRVSNYDTASEIARTRPGANLFDDRCDFTAGLFQAGLAVLMIFTNDRCLQTTTAPGLRRQVRVALVDADSHNLLESKVATVSIPKSELMGMCRIDFKLMLPDIDFTHHYMVAVYDASTGQLMGDHIFRFYEENLCANHIDEWFAIKQAGIALGHKDSPLCRAFNGQWCENYYVRFDIEGSALDLIPHIPNMEIRLYHGDGSMEARFVQPDCDCDTEIVDGSHATLHAIMPFFVDYHRRGVCYAELVCLDYVIGGFVFHNSTDPAIGGWCGPDLKALDEYSLEAATERLRRAGFFSNEADDEEAFNDGLDDTDDNTEGTPDDDEFEARLNAFISGCLDDSDNSEDCEETPDCDDSPEPEPCVAQYMSHLTGLDEVKVKLCAYETLVKFYNLRKRSNLPAQPLPLHSMFMGSPGTGKTTVAKLMGQMLAKAGILSKGHVVVRERSMLIGRYYSMEETLTRKAIDEAQGGILFIDEAYQLHQPDDPRDPGRLVIETLMTALSDESRRDWMLILAGYPDKMRSMFEMNPGLRSRIPESNIYVFDDFTPDQLMEIAENYLHEQNYELSAEARKALALRLDTDFNSRDHTFGNARHVINLIQTDIIPAMASRVIRAANSGTSLSAQDLTQILPSDIPSSGTPLTAPRATIGFRA